LRFREEDRPQSIAEWRAEFKLVETALSSAGQLPPASNEEDPTFRMVKKAVPPPADNKVVSPPPGVPRQRKIRRPGRWTVAAALVAGLFILGVFLVSPMQNFINQRNRNAEIQRLLGEAKQDLEALRLIEPQDDNALQSYRKVLELDPRNAEASQGLKEVTGRLVTLARQAVAANNFAEAERYLSDAEAILPEFPDINLARKELEMKKMFLERVETEKKARIKKLQEMLSAAKDSARKGDFETTLSRLEEARAFGAGDQEIAAIKDLLRSTLESKFAATTKEGQQALSANDVPRARAALQRAKDIRSQIDSLASP
jgi:hypothetical protein